MIAATISDETAPCCWSRHRRACATPRSDFPDAARWRSGRGACAVHGQRPQDALHAAAPRRCRDPGVVACGARWRSGRSGLPELARGLPERRCAAAARRATRRNNDRGVPFARGPLDHAAHALWLPNAGRVRR